MSRRVREAQRHDASCRCGSRISRGERSRLARAIEDSTRSESFQWPRLRPGPRDEDRALRHCCGEMPWELRNACVKLLLSR